MEYRKCFVPTCNNNTKNSPNKIFVRIREDLREKWCRDVGVEYYKVYKMYCCEDHFDPKKDLMNYHQHKLMNQEPRLKPTASICLAPKSKDSTELYKLLLQHPTQKPAKRKYENTVVPSTSSYTKIPVKNEESISEDDTIHVFCPKCNTIVPHTAEEIQQDQTKMLIAKVYHYFEKEYEELKKMYGNLDLSPLSKFRQRTAEATGVSDSMLQQILEEERRREEKKRTRAHKRRKQEDSSDDENSDDSGGDAKTDKGVQEEGQLYAATETLVVKIEEPEFNDDEPEVFIPAPLKEEPSDYDYNNEQVTTDPISLEIKTEPQEHEIPIVTQELTKPGTSKHKERKRTRTSQNTSTQSRLLDRTEEIDVNGEGYS